MPSAISHPISGSFLPRPLARPVPVERRPAAPPVAPTGVAVALRGFSVWPFGTRTLGLFMVVYPSVDDEVLTTAMLRAMQDEYFRSEGRSQTNALRSALLAAHYVLKHRNDSRLPHERASASAACAVTRGGSHAFVALAGEAMAFAFDGSTLKPHFSGSRVARPLGADAPPKVAFCGVPLTDRDRLVLTCGAAWADETLTRAEELLRGRPDDEAQLQLAALWAGPEGPARVVVATGRPPTEREAESAATVVRPAQRHSRPPAAAQALPRQARPARRWPFLLALGAVALAAVALGLPRALEALPLPERNAARQVEALLTQATQEADQARAYGLAEEALQIARERAPTNQALLERAMAVQRQVGRVAVVSPSLFADLAQQAAAVVDVEAGDGAIYALDVRAGSVYGFPEGQIQQTIVRAPVALSRGGTSQRAPLALAWLPSIGGAAPALGVFDQSRMVTMVGAGGAQSPVGLPGRWTWGSVTSIAVSGRAIYLLDATQGQLHEYSLSGLAPRVLLNAAANPALPLQQATDVAADTNLHLRFEDGSLRRFDLTGHEQPFAAQVNGQALADVRAIAPDRHGGLYLAQPSANRIVHVAADGRFLRQIHVDGQMLAEARALETSLDGQRLYVVDGTTIWLLDLVDTPF